MAKNSMLGVSFTYDSINIVEQQAGKAVNSIKIHIDNKPEVSAGPNTTKGEADTAELIKNTLAEQNIATQEAVLALLSKDLIIRFFEIPLVPRSEIASTVGFEAKKYVPFKLEELIFDFQPNIDRKNKKIAILFISIRREIIDRYMSILEQAGLSIVSVEPMFFSVMRAVKHITKAATKAPIAIIDVDSSFERGDITVIERFYPLLSRDLNLKIYADKDKDAIESIALKLGNEIRISLDYYRRQFPGSFVNIEELILLAPRDSGALGETLTKELEMKVLAPDINDSLALIGKELDLEQIRAYGASLLNKVSLPIKINLLAKMAIKEAEERPPANLENILTIIAENVDKNFVIKNVAVFLIVASAIYLLGLRQVMAVNTRLKSIKTGRQKLSILKDMKKITYPALQTFEKEYEKKIQAVEKLETERSYLTPKLSAVAKSAEKGIWLDRISFDDKQDKQNLIIRGFVYLADGQKEFVAVNQFLSNLKASEEFSSFKDISLGEVSRLKKGEFDLTSFEIQCRDVKM
ncbi:MAG: hypothetical protein COV72_07050 [Candidatus Omnitrophica bacterium CG11_big_fil_rev_8_21_14_0_20_42_13]|uniref:SHS2 domain-containing protein n=1 Tax=Candidatus Ghiorseimicrobium undicola TaxID=1974746 RepID=A0A2H0LWA1_9BACT|nr:MAG: hypothetical protein COV72_07050 [Candidatus Omnitrophica bacterium CG11_big_fil_rev_8_21_14_0_20_42_13]